MRILLTKIFIIYIEFNILIAQIEVALFILLTGIITAKYSITNIILPFLKSIQIIPSKFLHCSHNDSSNLIHSETQTIEFIYTNQLIGYNTQLIDEIVVEDSVISLVGEEERRTLKIKEQWHVVQDQSSSPSGKLHIGLVFEVINSENDIVFCVDVLVSSSLFFQFPMEAAKLYLIAVAEEDDGSVILAEELHHNICGSRFQLGDIYDLPDLPLIIKTYWIRIIQRRWRRVYSMRLKLRGSLKAQRQFELSGSYGYLGGGLRGMLSNTGTP